MIKKGTTPTLLIRLALNVEDVVKITFTFRQGKDEISLPMLQKIYPEEISYNEGVFFIPFSQEETNLFKNVFYAEAQINYNDNLVDKTNIVALEMSDTLFTEVI